MKDEEIKQCVREEIREVMRLYHTRALELLSIMAGFFTATMILFSLIVDAWVLSVLLIPALLFAIYSYKRADKILK